MHTSFFISGNCQALIIPRSAPFECPRKKPENSPYSAVLYNSLQNPFLQQSQYEVQEDLKKKLLNSRVFCLITFQIM